VPLVGEKPALLSLQLCSKTPQCYHKKHVFTYPVHQYGYTDKQAMSTYCEIFAESQGTLLGNGTINSDTTMEDVTPCNITNGSTAGNGVFYAVCTNSYVMQEQNYYCSCVFCWVSPEAISPGTTG
jgi:hypothetical protein